MGKNGSDGITPTIGENGNWYLGTTDTGKPSRGADGKDGAGADVSGASVGQLVRIAAVDASGVPTAWEAIPPTAVEYVAQSLTDDQKEIARGNIDVYSKSEVASLVSGTSEEWTDLSNRFVLNKAVALDPDKVAVGAEIPSASGSETFKTLRVDCSPGDEFEIKGYGNASTIRLWAFADAANLLLSRANGTAAGNHFLETPLALTAPESAAYLIVNMRMADTGTYVKKKTQKSYAAFVKSDIKAYKVALPAWAQVHPFKDYNGTYTYTNAMNGADYGFSSWYALFHGLMTGNPNCGLVETDIGAQYNAAKGETTPTYISSVTNGAMLMYHLPPPNTDGSGYTSKHKTLKVVLCSGIHGGERKSIWDNYILLKQLCESTFAAVGAQLPERAILNLRNFVDLYVIPMINVSGIDAATRANSNSPAVNLNRDFPVSGWGATSDSGSTASSQWETRVVAYAIDQIDPDVVIDHHTSSGDNIRTDANPSGEPGKFIAWGNSDIPALMSVVEENIMEITPYVKFAFPEKLGSTNFVFGHTADNSAADMKTGTMARWACQKGKVGLTYEAVQHLRWTPAGTDRIFGFSDTEEIQLASINYFGYVNMLMKVLDTAKTWINQDISV